MADETESIIDERKANHFRYNALADGGRLILTSKELIFSPHAINLPGGELRIPLSSIKSITMKNRFLISKQIIVITDQKSECFVVWNREPFIENIQKAIHNQPASVSSTVSYQTSSTQFNPKHIGLIGIGIFIILLSIPFTIIGQIQSALDNSNLLYYLSLVIVSIGMALIIVARSIWFRELIASAFTLVFAIVTYSNYSFSLKISDAYHGVDAASQAAGIGSTFGEHDNFYSLIPYLFPIMIAFLILSIVFFIIFLYRYSKKRKT